MSSVKCTKTYFTTVGIISITLHAMRYGMIFNGNTYDSVSLCNGAIDFNSVIGDNING